MPLFTVILTVRTDTYTQHRERSLTQGLGDFIEFVLMWTYFRTPLIELGIPHKKLRSQLRPHVHSSVQIMVVTKGSRNVQLGGRSIVVLKNSILVIPSGVPHTASEHDWDGFNAYIDSSVNFKPAASFLHFKKFPYWTRDIGSRLASCDIPSLLDLISDGKIVWSDPELSQYPSYDRVLSNWPQSREGHIRRYQREAGISPYAHAKAIQLDQARSRIRNGDSISAVAADLGFTDQSHLGRQFLAVFGTTPGRYAKS